MRYLLSLTTIFVFALAGCAAPQPTQYMAADQNDKYGYTDTALTDTQYRIDFTGNRHTKDAQVKDYVMYRAAQLTLEKGYDWFVILDSETDREKQTRTETSSRVAERTVVRECGLLGCSSYVSPVYSGVGISTYEVDGKITSSLQIAIGKGQPEDRNAAFDAKKLASNLSNKVN